jgi:protein phosphatase
MHFKLTAADKSDVGKQREQNEDKAYKRIESLEDGDRGLFIVADGMGGYKAGEIASQLAVDTISRGLDSFFKPIPDQPTIQLSITTQDPDETVVKKPGPATDARADARRTNKLAETYIGAAAEDQLKAAIQQANRAILRYGEQKPSAHGLGSTVTVALVRNDHAFIANVGDSRTYLLRDNKLLPVTKDHSLVQKLVEANQITQDDVYTHPQRNLIYRSLGAGHKNIEVDVFQEKVQPGDTFLLCSDGLWEMVRHEDLKKLLSEQHSPQKICDKLIDMANANGGEDNITAIVVHISKQ